MSITIIFNKVCPFAQRALIAARQKGLDFTAKQVSLTQKEPYFTQTYEKSIGRDPSNSGKVPILVIQDMVLAESDLICWFLAQKYQIGTNLIPKDLVQRAKMRHVIQTLAPSVISTFYSFIGANLKSQQEQQKLKNSLIKTLTNLDSVIVGPYILGEEFSLADVLIYPWFQRFCVLEDLYKIQIPEELIKLRKFINALQERPSIKQHLLPREYFVEAYRDYMIK